MKLFGYVPTVYYPKQNLKNEFFTRLTTQLQTFKIKVITDELSRLDLTNHIQNNDFVVDSMFGFSFKPPMREPFGTIVEELIKSQLKVVSVDIPTGWDVDEGPDTSKEYLKPLLLVSLTSPKPCSVGQTGFVHYLGGRFVDQGIASKWGFDVPEYPGIDEVVKLN